MWIRGKIFLKEFVEGCINFDRRIKEIRKDCKPDISFPSDALILPGSVDMHVHVRGLELSYKETVTSATSEAIYGGVTTIMDMPNTVPFINSPEKIKERLREFDNYSRTNFGVYSGVTSNSEVEKLPIAGYKVFPEDLEKQELKFVLSSRKLKVLHPEIPLSLNQFRNLRRTWQEIAALDIIKGNFHVTHSTNYETIRISKSKGFTTDFTPHHLLLNGETNCLTKVNPPIRSVTERRKLLRALWEADAIVSDHAPHTQKEKEMPYQLCPPGVAAVSFTTPFIYSLAMKGIISFDRAVELLSINPSKILGIKAGKIEQGYFADFVIIRLSRWRYSTRFSKVIETPFDRYPLDSTIVSVIVQGKIAYDGGEIYPVRGVNAIEDSRH
ncbi:MULTISPECIES: dihydroorotase [Acidianus]|uniref:Dihydroorotase n=1 Tax=Candidatus Acidianus copahuensis TaxID=1160895 RepID=A0A031LLA3_9CREN|nr:MULTISPECIES: dihydroorotase [Acidianus]EZQ04827.1 dihydroorotase [Candidatus Acidianus copahuensis]NON62783.1 dihydroorotase [Acidianus sp. RZ1]